MKKRHVILDNGHGGMIDGAYVTAPNKMFKHNENVYIYEGVFNRKIVAYLSCMLSDLKLNHTILVPEQEDISLKERVKRINKLYERHEGRVMTVSIHGNAGGGTGFEVFTSRGQTLSDEFADIFVQEMSRIEPTMRTRVDKSDGDLDKEANFRILMGKGPAVLTENFFMDNYKDCIYMLSDNGQISIAEYHADAIKKITDINK
jgi:N-acetylmuramoyl-L-alanine amidase